MSVAPSIPRGLEERLRQHDSRLRIHWDHELDVWQIQEFLQASGRWSHVFYWADSPSPGVWTYRPLPTSADPILRYLADIDLVHFGGPTKHAWRKYVNHMDESRRRWAENRKSTWQDVAKQHCGDFLQRARGKRETFYMGKGGRPRTRRGNDGSDNLRGFKEQMRQSIGA